MAFILRTDSLIPELALQFTKGLETNTLIHRGKTDSGGNGMF